VVPFLPAWAAKQGISRQVRVLFPASPSRACGTECSLFPFFLPIRRTLSLILPLCRSAVACLERPLKFLSSVPPRTGGRRSNRSRKDFSSCPSRPPFPEPGCTGLVKVPLHEIRLFPPCWRTMSPDGGRRGAHPSPPLFSKRVPYISPLFFFSFLGTFWPIPLYIERARFIFFSGSGPPASYAADLLLRTCRSPQIPFQPSPFPWLASRRQAAGRFFRNYSCFFSRNCACLSNSGRFSGRLETREDGR